MICSFFVSESRRVEKPRWLRKPFKGIYHGIIEAFSACDAYMWLLPPILYLLGAFVSFATGTSWGTFGILIPITFAIFGYEVTELCVICLSATLAGAVTGDHCSPISETAIMSSTAAQVDFMTHVMTQMPYALFTAAFSLIGFTALGIVQHWIVVPVMMVVLVLVLIGLKSAYKNKQSFLCSLEEISYADFSARTTTLLYHNTPNKFSNSHKRTVL